MKTKSLLIFLIFLMFSKASIASDTQDQINRWKAVCMDAVQQKLKDPESARFRNVQFFRGIKNMPLCSGEVNSKNSFGGYGGYQRFISAGNLNTTFLEEQVQDFDGTLRTLKGK